MIRPMTVGEAEKAAGNPRYKIIDGTVTNLDAWASKNIIPIIVPQLARMRTWSKGRVNSEGRIFAHRIIRDQIVAAFAEIEEKGFLGDVLFWGGTIARRARRSNPNVISLHALGLAFDLNPSYYQMGDRSTWVAHDQEGSLDRIIPIFEAHGIINGQVFDDKHHFELGIDDQAMIVKPAIFDKLDQVDKLTAEIRAGLTKK